MDLGIQGRKAVVLGGTKDTGKAITDALRREGVEVLAIGRDSFNLDGPLHGLIEAAGKPDIVVHVVGGSIGFKDATGPAITYSRVWYHNLGQAIDLNNAFIPSMLERGWGRIVHFSSNGVKLAIGNAPYTSSKAAIEGYVRTYSKELSAKGVVMTCVSPGPIYTEGRFMYSQDKDWTDSFFDSYVPMRRWGRPDEISGLVAFLCSEHASYMAGAIVDCDGGMR